MQRTWADAVEDQRREKDRERLGHMLDVTVSMEDVGTLRVENGAKRFRAHILSQGFECHAEADTPQKALVLAAMLWHKMTK